MDLSLESIVAILLIVAILGAILWAAEVYLPIPQPFKGIVMFFCIALGLLWLARRLSLI